MRARGRRIPDGRLRAAALMRSDRVRIRRSGNRPDRLRDALDLVCELGQSLDAGSTGGAGGDQSAVKTLEGGGVLLLPQLAFALSATERRFLSPHMVRRQGQEHQLRRRTHSRARAAAPTTSRTLARMVARFAAVRRRPGDGALSALRAVRQARAHELPPAARRRAARCPGARTTRGCTSTRFRRARTTASASCACSRNVSPDEDRVWRVGERFEAVARKFLAADRRGASRRCATAACGAARDQGPAQRVRSSDAGSARPRQGRSRLPDELSRSRSCVSRRERHGCAFPTR